MPYQVLNNTRLNSSVCRLEIEAPLIARKVLPGQFIILHIDEKAERIPLTIYRAFPGKGTLGIIVQETGTSSKRICALAGGDSIADVIGPLGIPTEIANFGRVVCVGGGVGVAEVCPVACALKAAGNEVTVLLGARSREFLILEDEMMKAGLEVFVATDDGSYQNKGYVSDLLSKIVSEEKVDRVFAVGPVPMMRKVAEITRPQGIPTIVSLNSIMVDGTGMCGSCRVTIDGKTKFVCVDGPNFDAHRVDFDEVARREKRFAKEQKASQDYYDKGHKKCHIR